MGKQYGPSTLNIRRGLVMRIPKKTHGAKNSKNILDSLCFHMGGKS